MRLLFVHQNFPGQYLHLEQHYAADKTHEIVAITDDANRRPAIVRTIRYAAPEQSARRIAGLAGHFVGHVARAEAVAGEAETLRRKGFVPDVILGHCG